LPLKAPTKRSVLGALSLVCTVSSQIMIACKGNGFPDFLFFSDIAGMLQPLVPALGTQLRSDPFHFHYSTRLETRRAPSQSFMF